MAENMFGISKRFHAFYCHALFFFQIFSYLVSRQIMVRIGKFIKGSQQSLIRPFPDRCLFAAADQKNGFFLDLTGLFRRFIRDRIQ